MHTRQINLTDDERGCSCCKRQGVPLYRSRLMKAENICRACIITWYETGIVDRQELARASLEAGERWL
jgi:hypothetical protein